MGFFFKLALTTVCERAQGQCTDVRFKKVALSLLLTSVLPEFSRMFESLSCADGVNRNRT